ncbi:hypothetical protein [Streptomyces hirsutus]|uniref:hypothetical protein n=1 Tax=Streptomyces hirsutus TaxID=35620 RepID=UPI0033254C2F
MNTLLEALAGQAETIVNGLMALAGGLVIWRLTNWSRDRADRQTELATFHEQADRLVVAIADVRGSVDFNRRLWEHPLEQVRYVALVAIAAVGEGALMRVRGGSPREMFAAGMGAAARLGLHESRASKSAVAALREPMLRVNGAAAPLLRHPDERVAETTDELLSAMGDIQNAPRIEAALEAFRQAVVAVAQPQPSWWGRLRRRLTRTTGT